MNQFCCACDGPLRSTRNLGGLFGGKPIISVAVWGDTIPIRRYRRGANLRNVGPRDCCRNCVEGILFELSNNPGDAMRPPLPSKLRVPYLREPPDPPQLALRPVPCTHEHALPGFLIVNDVLPRPCLPKFSYTRFRIVQRLHGHDEMQFSIFLHPVDEKRQAQPELRLGTAK